MANIDLQGLIDKVMGLIERGKKEGHDPNQSWDDTEAGQKYWENKRKREGDKQQQDSLLGIEREKEAGALSRANILKDTTLGEANIRSTWETDRNVKGLEGEKAKARGSMLGEYSKSTGADIAGATKYSNLLDGGSSKDGSSLSNFEIKDTSGASVAAIASPTGRWPGNNASIVNPTITSIVPPDEKKKKREDSGVSLIGKKETTLWNRSVKPWLDNLDKKTGL